MVSCFCCIFLPTEINSQDNASIFCTFCNMAIEVYAGKTGPKNLLRQGVSPGFWNFCYVLLASPHPIKY